jgi:hypothetical protein
MKVKITKKIMYMDTLYTVTPSRLLQSNFLLKNEEKGSCPFFTSSPIISLPYKPNPLIIPNTANTIHNNTTNMINLHHKAPSNNPAKAIIVPALLVAFLVANHIPSETNI